MRTKSCRVCGEVYQPGFSETLHPLRGFLNKYGFVGGSKYIHASCHRKVWDKNREVKPSEPGWTMPEWVTKLVKEKGGEDA